MRETESDLREVPVHIEDLQHCQLFLTKCNFVLHKTFKNILIKYSSSSFDLACSSDYADSPRRGVLLLASASFLYMRYGRVPCLQTHISFNQIQNSILWKHLYSINVIPSRILCKVGHLRCEINQCHFSAKETEYL